MLIKCHGNLHSHVLLLLIYETTSDKDGPLQCCVCSFDDILVEQVVDSFKSKLQVVLVGQLEDGLLAQLFLWYTRQASEHGVAIHNVTTKAANGHANGGIMKDGGVHRGVRVCLGNSAAVVSAVVIVAYGVGIAVPQAGLCRSTLALLLMVLVVFLSLLRLLLLNNARGYIQWMLWQLQLSYQWNSSWPSSGLLHLLSIGSAFLDLEFKLLIVPIVNTKGE